MVGEFSGAGRAPAMLLEIPTTRSPASDLGSLLEKHPARVHDF